MHVTLELAGVDDASSSCCSSKYKALAECIMVSNLLGLLSNSTEQLADHLTFGHSHGLLRLNSNHTNQKLDKFRAGLD